MGIQLSDRVENIMRKGEVARESNFSFSRNVFKSCLLLICQNEYLWSKGLTDFCDSLRSLSTRLLCISVPMRIFLWNDGFYTRYQTDKIF